MLSWILNNPMIVAIFLLFLVILAYALWLRFRMAVSKARFALATLGALTTCLASSLAFISGWIPVQIVQIILSSVGVSQVPGPVENTIGVLLGVALSVTSMVLIYRFASQAIRDWDGPVTVTVNDLAKERQDNSLLLLAGAEAKRLLALKPDPLASDVAVNWQQKLSPAPATPQWHLLARELFEAAFSEALFSDRSWRDRSNAWVGEIYASQTHSADTVPLVLFVFDEKNLTEAQLTTRLERYVADGASLENAQIYAVFDSGKIAQMRHMSWAGRAIEVWPRGALVRQGLKLTGYARDLIRRFESEPLGGTEATLKDTFVEAHINRPGIDERRSATEVISAWLNDKSRRHLAITGEYGQGKSTAMLHFCVDWAHRYLRDEAPSERIPLLIELRGKAPSEHDILSTWASRYGLSDKQLRNLIRAGEAIVIFEGFDELKNAGREYDRHEHFNALWRMAYPGTKVIFTGRPNFFLDDKEKNRTLRANDAQAAAGDAFTQVWEISRLTEYEIKQIVQGFGEQLAQSIMAKAGVHPAFLEIVSRPSMLPVVATIWEKIERLEDEGYSLNSGAIFEEYLKAIFLRKEAEIKKDEQIALAPGSANYLLLPLEVREIFTLLVVWSMASNNSRNTIPRSQFNAAIEQVFDDVFRGLQEQNTQPHITAAIRAFEQQFREDTKADKLERISTEIASAGLFVSDPAGGSSNLRLPHKQYYEYLIAKSAWIILSHENSWLSITLRKIAKNRNTFSILWSEINSLSFFSEIIGLDFSLFRRGVLKYYAAADLYINNLILPIFKEKRKKSENTFVFNKNHLRQTELLLIGTPFEMFLIGLLTILVGVPVALYGLFTDMIHIYTVQIVAAIFMLIFLLLGVIYIFSIALMLSRKYVCLRFIIAEHLEKMAGVELNLALVNYESVQILLESPKSLLKNTKGRSQKRLISLDYLERSDRRM